MEEDIIKHPHFNSTPKLNISSQLIIVTGIYHWVQKKMYIDVKSILCCTRDQLNKVCKQLVQLSLYVRIRGGC